MKLDTEQIYHLIDLLEMDVRHTLYKVLLDDKQKKEAIDYNNKIIKLLKNELKSKGL